MASAFRVPEGEVFGAQETGETTGETAWSAPRREVKHEDTALGGRGDRGAEAGIRCGAHASGATAGVVDGGGRYTTSNTN